MRDDEGAPDRATDATTRSSRRRTWIIARWLLILYGLYLVAGNLLVNSPPGQALANRQPEKFVASWDRGWTLYPGHLHVEGLKIAGHVRRTVWSVQADAASGRLALLSLLQKEIRLPRVDASGLTGGVTRIDIVREPRAPAPGGWTLRFDRIVGRGIRHAYLNSFVLSGDGSAEVGFAKTMRGGPLEVLPSEANFAHGTIWHDGKALARDTALDGRFAIERHTRAEAHGIQRLGKADVDLTIEATTAGLEIGSRSGGKPQPVITPGPGRLAGHLQWRHGSLEPGTTLGLSIPVASALSGERRGSEAECSLMVDEAGLRLHANLEPLPGNSVHANADIRIRDRMIPLSDIGSLAGRTSGELDAKWHFASLAWLAELLPDSRVVSFDGAGTVVANIRLADGAVVAGSTLEVPQVTATALALGNRFDGEARAKILYETVNGSSPRPRLEASMDEFRIAAADAPAEPFVRGRNLHIEASAATNPREIKNPASLREQVDARLTFKDAEVPDLRVYNRYLPSTSLRFRSGSGTLSGDLRFIGEDQVGSGHISIAGRAVELSLAGLALQGDVAVDTRLRRAELNTREFNADGSSISLRRVRVVGADRRPDEWWAEIKLDQSRLDWDRPMKFDGSLRMHMKDVGVLLDVYSQRKDLPAWVEKLVNAGEVTAEGNLQWRGDTLLLQPLEASNQRFDVLARLRLEHKTVTGDLFARWGALSLGVEMANGKRDLHFVRARNWYDGRPALPPP
jgi:hypothetical protein